MNGNRGGCTSVQFKSGLAEFSPTLEQRASEEPTDWSHTSLRVHQLSTDLEPTVSVSWLVADISGK